VNRLSLFSVLLLSILTVPALALAQDVDTDDDVDEAQEDVAEERAERAAQQGDARTGDARAEARVGAEGERSESLRGPEAYPEAPEGVRSSDLDVDVSDDVARQAGVGSERGYAREGVVELGGSIGLTWTERMFSFNVSPQIGYFIVDTFQLSAIIDIRYVNTGDGDTDVRTDSTVFTLLAEPSYHHPLSDTVFLFAGLGIGAAYNGVTAGFALQPRLGANFLIGRSGILTPAIYLQYVQAGFAQADASAALGLGVAYTVMW
jgi:hypothetical protein